MDSKRSYDRLGGPENVAVPSRRRPAQDLGMAGDEIGPDEEGSSTPHLSAACYVENQDTCPVALGTINEFGGLDGRMSSLPSSYRRLRKARSMFSTKQRATPQLPHGISSEAYSCNPGAVQEGQESPVEVRRMQGSLRRSMSFLRSGSQPSRSVRHAKSQDAAIQLARTQFMQSHKPSLTTLKPRQEYKPFRKTFRTTSGSVLDEAGTPYSGRSKNSARIHGKARIFSSTIKKGLKRVLGLSKPPEDHVSGHDSPVDQSQWDDFQSSTASGVNQGCASGSGYSNFDSPGPDYSPARPPTMRSVRSSDSLATSRSRVTSWADSTAAPTITNRRPGDKNSLSVVEENEVSIPGGRSRHGSPRPNTSVDGQRLYSALMKHIDRNHTDDGEENVVLGRVKEHRPVPERTSSRHTCRSGQTIHQIPSDDSMASPLSFATANASMVSPRKQRSRQSKHQYPLKHPQAADYDRFDDTSSLRRQPTDNLFAIGEDSDDDLSSVIVDRAQNPNEEDSPSVYSRATSGDSPKNVKAVRNTSQALKEEAGIAMIYESQRTVYSSPKRSGNPSSAATPTQPSADWQKWMKSQMERIETDPSRGHYREETQIVDDDDDVNTINHLAVGLGNGRNTERGSEVSLGLSETGSSLMDRKIPAQSNFSRPFSRSSSARTVAAPQKDYTADTDSNYMGRGLSLSVRSGNRLQQHPETPTPKRDASQPRRPTGQFRRNPVSRMPISREAKAVPFRSIRNTPRDNRHMTDENVKEGCVEVSNPYRYQSSYSPMSSKQMVDDFLDRRRRQMETEMPENNSGAFV